MNAMEEQIRQLDLKISQSYRQGPDTEFIYNGTSIVTGFGGKNPVKWALLVSKHLFTKEELMKHVLEATAKSDRPPIDRVRADLFKRALPVKFEFCRDQQKLDKHWALIVDRVNNQGRNIKYQLKQLFGSNNQRTEAANNVDTNTNFPLN
jgi:hypothetical protein